MKAIARFLLIASFSLFAKAGYGAPVFLVLPTPVSPQEFEAVSSVFDPVPTFFIATQGGSAVAFRMPDGETAIPVFLDPRAAEAFLEEEERNRPGGATAEWRIASMSLGGVYRYQIEQEGGQEENALRFMMVPSEKNVDSARAISGDESFSSVPVFIARRESGEPYTTTSRNGRTVIPMFLEADVLQAKIESLAESDESPALPLTIEAVPLESVVSSLASGSLDADKVSFVLPSGTLEYLQGQKER